MLASNAFPFCLLRALLTIAVVMSTGADHALADSIRRVPAEWEPQEAIWLQWPGRWEKSHETAFARISNVIARYETLHILHASAKIDGGRSRGDHARGRRSRSSQHRLAGNRQRQRLDARQRSRLRGRRQPTAGPELVPSMPGAARSAPTSPIASTIGVPARVAEAAGLPVEHVDIVHERGNLEFNGVDTLMLNWSVIGDPRRNRDYTREQAEADLKRHFGVSWVVFIEGVPDGRSDQRPHRRHRALHRSGHGRRRAVHGSLAVQRRGTPYRRRLRRRGRDDCRGRPSRDPRSRRRNEPIPGPDLRHKLPELAGRQRIRHQRRLR